MNQIFGLSLPSSLLVFCALGLIAYGIGKTALIHFARRVDDNASSVPLGAFIGPVATAWALSLGFAAADIWALNAKADQATNDERSSISRLLGISRPEVLDARQIHALTENYARFVIDEEWGRQKNTEPSLVVDSILHDIRREIVQLPAAGVPSPIISKIVNDFDELQDARIVRLSLGTTSIDMYKWYLLMFLTVLTVVTIAATHADRRKAGEIAIRIYVVTATFSLWIIAIHANPYLGIDRIEPTTLHQMHGQ